uniref:Alpha/beta hydrolase n=1 Tax=Caenorhabditis tropicalis TaxID=1561998 RepID=A0A1I7U252_9PELO
MTLGKDYCHPDAQPISPAAIVNRTITKDATADLTQWAKPAVGRRSFELHRTPEDTLHFVFLHLHGLFVRDYSELSLRFLLVACYFLLSKNIVYRRKTFCLSQSLPWHTNPIRCI